MRRTHGIIVETRAQAVPNLAATGEYREIDQRAVESFSGSTPPFDNQRRPWSANVELTQTLYSGGRVRAALRAAKLSDQIAVLNYNAAVADVVLQVRRAFYEILLNTQLVTVREESLKLLEQQLADVKHRFDVGAVPQFNVLRAEVEVANAKPPLIRARNALRINKVQLGRLLAYSGDGTTRDTDFRFAGELTSDYREWQLPPALTAAVAHRPELQIAEKQAALRRQNVTVARAGYFPEISAFAGYGIRDTTFSDQIDDTVHGWNAGARARWNIFDGLATRGKVEQARAEFSQAELDYADTRRGIELEVRQAFYDYQQALELLDAQRKTVEQATESLRLAEARFRAGSGTQLDVLSARTAHTDASSNEVQALFEYNVALATLERATGTTVKAE